MSFGGHVLDMVNRMKANEALKKAHRAKYRRIRDAYINSTNSKLSGKLTSNTISKEEMEVIKAKIRVDLRRERRIELVLTYSVTLLLSIAVFIIILFLRRG